MSCTLALLTALLLAPFATLYAVEGPIQIHFNLTEPGYVTLVIEDAEGRRVRNLISETPFPAGTNVAEWDGLDDLGRDPEAARHAVYHVPGKIVPPGSYRVRGLVRPALKLLYEMTPYNPGNPPWRTAESSSQWLANHTPPSAVLFLPAGAAPIRETIVDEKNWNGAKLTAPTEKRPPYQGGQVLVCSHVSEGGSGLAWLDAEGRKLHGQMWLGGVWTAATHLARDTGRNPVPGVYAYAAAYWRGDKYNNYQAELRLHELVHTRGKRPQDSRFGTGEDRPVLTPTYKFIQAEPGAAKAMKADKEERLRGLTGLAVRDGLIVAALTKTSRLLFVDGHARRVIGSATLTDPRAVAFDAQGRLLALSGRKLLRFAPPDFKTQAGSSGAETALPLSAPDVVIAAGLEDPQQMALDGAGNLFISDWGHSHQVKVFSPAGEWLRTIGTPGEPKVGPYDPNHMHHPNGVTLDDQNRLWVAESDKNPKRVSVWDAATGKLLKALYGPPKYGGGGTLDPADPRRFFYTDEGGGIEFAIDWKTGADHPVAITYRPGDDTPPLRAKYVGQGPETPVHFGGRTYLTDCYVSDPTKGARTANLWLYENGVARPVAAFGSTRGDDNEPFPIFTTDAFRAALPAGIKIEDQRRPLLFAWSDRNDDGRMQPEETTFSNPANKGQVTVSGVTVQRDLSVAIARAGDQALHLVPQGFTRGGAPLYDATRAKVLAEGVQNPGSSGHDQVLVGAEGWSVLTTPPQPFAREGVCGVKNGVPMWSYPSPWPGLHASHIAALPDRPGLLTGTTRLLGPLFTVPGSDLGELWAINGNKGTVYIFTIDGLFVATLFQDHRLAKPWPVAEQRGTDLSGQSIGEENFAPTLTQTDEGKIYLQVAHSGIIVRLEGLERAHRLAGQTLEVSSAQLEAASAFHARHEAERQREQGAKESRLVLASSAQAPKVDGQLDDWAGAAWMLVDERKQKVGNFGSRVVKTEAALRIAGDRLYAAFRTDDAQLLINSGEALQNLFKTGGCLDLMVGANPQADPARTRAVAGDVRLLVTQVKQQTTAMLYRPVAPDGVREPVEFTSPVRSLRFDRVDNVSSEVVLATSIIKDEKTKTETGVCEFSVPLRVLGLKPAAGLVLRGDIGVLRGNGFETTQRVYWNNKATGLVSDLPSEAELTPNLWGAWKIMKE